MAMLSEKARNERHLADAASAADDQIGYKLVFLKKLQAVSNAIHSTPNIDEIIEHVSHDVCELLNADRLTIYTVSEEGSSLVSKVKIGLQSFKDIKLPINNSSIAGFAAFNRKLINVSDCYDETELKRYAPPLTYLKEVDRRTGYRCKQILAAPILAAEGRGELLGVLQVINCKSGARFPVLVEEGASEIAKTLGIAFSLRKGGQHHLATKFDYLVAQGIVSAGELDLASRTARRKGRGIEDILTDEFQVSLADLGASLASYYSVTYEPLNRERVKPFDLFRNLKRDYIESNQWLPLEDASEGLVILTTDPERVRSLRVVENVFPRTRLEYRVTTQREFKKTVEVFFDPASSLGDGATIGQLLSGLEEDEQQETSLTDLASQAQDNELVKFVNKIIEDAYRQGASDIHIEPYPGKGKTQVRFRIDGSLRNYIEVPAGYRAALVTRIKIMCDLDISEKRKPQDGKIKYRRFGPIDIELRVATLPSAGGLEDVVLRVLQQGEPLPLEQLGMSRRNMDLLKQLVTKPYGLFFVCGPTGSGKTTTLHSALSWVNNPETKIWTAEDPVEITQRGLRQVQMNPKAGLNFATAMRAFLRADPDVIMVGEMRDKETAAVGVEASLTGHLVLTTLHTNSAPESIVRLLDMGMDPFNFSDALLGVLAQRLAKRLCVKCKRPHIAGDEEIQQLITEYSLELENTPAWQENTERSRAEVHAQWLREFAKDGRLTLYTAPGCETCAKSGYKGRVGLHELLVGSPAIKRLVLERAPVSSIFAVGLEEGMRTLKQDGIEKVLQGVTDIAQVRAVCSR